MGMELFLQFAIGINVRMHGKELLRFGIDSIIIWFGECALEDKLISGRTIGFQASTG